MEFKEFISDAGLIVDNEKTQTIYRQAFFLASRKAAILIHGGSGTGKSRLAEFIHQAGSRSKKPFIVVYCNAIPPELFASELFGYTPGAFTGASVSGKTGLLEAADGGTVLFDEINELSPENQATLLHFLQNSTITPIGSVEEKVIDTRILSTSGRNLKEMVEEGSFRLDLYYRIRVVDFLLPPIKERRDEIMDFIHYFIRRHAAEFSIDPSGITFTPEEEEKLCRHDWPGNIRELENFALQLCLTLDKESLIRSIEEEWFHPQESPSETASDIDPLQSGIPGRPAKGCLSLKEATERFQKEYIRQAIESCSTLQEAADKLGISLSTLMRKK